MATAGVLSLLWLWLLVLVARAEVVENIFTDSWADSWKVVRNCDTYDHEYSKDTIEGVYAVFCSVDGARDPIIQLFREKPLEYTVSYLEFYVKRQSGYGTLNVTLAFTSGISVDVPVSLPYVESINEEWHLFRVGLNEISKPHDGLIAISFYSSDSIQSLVFDSIKVLSAPSSLSERSQLTSRGIKGIVEAKDNAKQRNWGLVAGIPVGVIAIVALIALTIFSRVKKALPKSPSHKSPNNNNNEDDDSDSESNSPSLATSRSLPDLPSSATAPLSPASSPVPSPTLPPKPPTLSPSLTHFQSSSLTPSLAPGLSPSITHYPPHGMTSSTPMMTSSPMVPKLSPRPPRPPRTPPPPKLPPRPQLSAERLSNLSISGNSLLPPSPRKDAPPLPPSPRKDVVSYNGVPVSQNGYPGQNWKAAVVEREKEEEEEEAEEEEEEDDEDLDEYETVRRNATTKEEKGKKEQKMGLSLTALFIPPPAPPKPVAATQVIIEPEPGMELVNPIVKDACQYLAMKGLKEEGILRLAGSSAEVARLQASYKDNETPNFDTCFDINSVADLLKRHLRGLPEPLINVHTLPPFQEALKATDTPEKIALIQLAFQNPLLTREKVMTLKVLFLFLHQVMQYASINKMTSANLAVVFSPTLRMPSELVDIFVKYADQIFAW